MILNFTQNNVKSCDMRVYKSIYLSVSNPSCLSGCSTNQHHLPSELLIPCEQDKNCDGGFNHVKYFY